VGLRPTPESVRQGWYSLAFVLIFLAFGMPLLVLSGVIAGKADAGRALAVSLVAVLGGAAGFFILRRMRRRG